MGSMVMFADAAFLAVWFCSCTIRHVQYDLPS